MSDVRRGAASAVGVAALLAVTVAGPAPGGVHTSAVVARVGLATASAGTPGYCPDNTGVTVVVDMSALGGDVVVRCAPGPVDAGFSGIDALHDAGFDVSGTQRYGLAFVCRIQGRPAAGETLAIPGNGEYHEQCVDTPPQTAFWGYWYAPNGGTWSYSSVGAASRDATPGGFEGWAFSLGHDAGSSPEPGVDPVRSARVAPPPSTSAPPHSGGGGPTSSPPSSEPPSTHPSRSDPPPRRVRPSPLHPPTSAPSTAASPPATTTQPSTSSPGTAESSDPGGSAQPRHGGTPPGSTQHGKHAGATPTPSVTPLAPTTGTARDVQVTGEVPDSPDQSASSVRPTLVGLGVLVVLGLGAGLTAWRRSHRP